MTQSDRGTRNASMIRLYAQGLGYRAIAERFGMSFQNVQQTLKKYGVESRPAGRVKKSAKSVHVPASCTENRENWTYRKLSENDSNK